MGKIYYLMGKSASGKDTIYNRLISDESLDLRPFVGYTTRPMRSGECEGVEYHFTTEADMESLRSQGRLIESRVYHTVYGDWYYYNVFSEETDPEQADFLCIGTLESYIKFRDFYGEDTVVPIYIEVEDGLRLKRALNRERKQSVPGYLEMCRRFITDSEDFSEDKLAEAGITRRFNNIDVENCLDEIKEKVFR